MNKDYLTSTHTKAKKLSVRKSLLSIALLFFISFAFAQSTITITTTSNFVAWNLSYSNPSSGLVWTAVGPGVNLTTTPTFTPTFDFTPNAANGVITVSTSGTPATFAGITLFQADNPVGLQITTIDVTDLPNLEDLRLTDNLLTSIDVSQNLNLRILNLKRNDLAAIDISNNAALEELYLDANTNLVGLDISNNPNLTTLSAAALLNITSLDISNNPELTSLNLAFVPLTSTSIDDILNRLDAFGKLNGSLDLQNTTGGVITKNGIQAYINLINKGWAIKPPQGFDFGDAPSSYLTQIADGGAIHLVDDLHDELRLGSAKDKEPDGLISVNADGDDNDNFDDEDGVNPTEFDGIQTSTTNISIDVTILNNYSSNSQLHAWLDLDRSGTFDADEYATLTIAPNTGVGIVTLNWDITALGADIDAGLTYARFRYTKDNDLDATSVGGYATGGEVEDYSFTILGDFDKDGIPDITDVDDDNDGILDTVENKGGATDIDTDGDGMPDRIDLDADGDGCLDVTEAGFTDGDGDGYLGNSPVTVDANGQVTSGADGYTPPNDLDGNGTPDFQEAGTAATITTQPVDQDLIIGTSTFSVVANAGTYQWEESQDGGTTWTPLVDGGDYAGTTTPDLVVTNSDITKLNYKYHVIVDFVSFACAPPVTSTEAGYITPDDFDGDGIFDIVDIDDDNDGILDTVEDNGTVDRDTDGNGMPDRIDLDADGDGCFDVTEAGFTDPDNDGMLGTSPVAVNPDGSVVGHDYTILPNDLDGNSTPDFQEAGTAATITTQPVDQNFIIGVVSFSVVANADTYQWQVDMQDGSGFQDITDGGDISGATTATLSVNITDTSPVNYKVRVIVSNIAFACDPTTTSAEVGFNTPGDFDGDGVFDVVDVDDDNDGILDVDEAGNTVAASNPDRINLDSDGDGCPDVSEAGFTNNGADMLGTANPPVVDATGKVTSETDGYTLPLPDRNGSGTPDVREAGAAATITTPPADQNLIPTQAATFDVVATADTFQWEESTDGGTTWTALTDGGNYSGTLTASLLVSNLDLSMINNLYRVQVSNISYVCDPVTASTTAGFISLPDFDGDNVPDIVDLDDDNDGILDTVEGETTDTTGDGQLDKVNLDADGDGCFDVKEAGFADPDNDGILGTSPVSVDANGLVTGQGGYTAPNDLNNNGTFDFQEAGTAATITTQPSDQDFNFGGTATFSVITTGDTYQWEESTDNGATWTPLTEGGGYTGVNTNQLTVSNADINMYFNDYRVLVSNIAFACDSGTYSDIVSYNELPDTDGDGIFDVIDVDDDNDGILDTVEENGDVNRDTDGDGVVDRLDWDADGDGCPDVTEAGFTNNGNDMLGTKNPPDVDAEGKVTSATDGYTTPNDLNNSGIPDFQEAGSPSAITSQPSDIEVTLGDNAVFAVSGNATYYRWQVSTDNGSTWSDLTDDAQYSGTKTNTLTVIEARGRVESNLYRVILSTPDYACDPNPELISQAGKLMFNQARIPNGFSPNGDGENDVFSIPGLDQYPNFKMKIFDRWGNMVYHYENNGSADPRWWDGLAKGSMVLSDGQRVPAGTYYYMIDYNDGSTKPIKGWVYVNY